ncbi:uncharacterized protein TRIADDRAFT_31000 [Trichoplax adhaerens]|uniref:Solute carrier organic anion transporter family member n=1 Tax=Trichoplax adhaerens TaxID=10228 RepID=B3S8K8_TRIAD|nr:hypothetical protein TRIADDRAFT_31000 [Trichoplax adhaerens]EDV20902.1 hypothetical protein TRIADDRAFT_31000 [Trichoplax adhaerens]|eukprot:XP_002116546.1 hypothetical protein TRIADDRAFT_31000 [Trichoplax adhaerens]
MKEQKTERRGSQLPPDQRFGCFNFHPNWLQVFNHHLCLAFWIGICQLFYGFITTGYDASIVSTIQKGFGLSSADIGGTTVCYSIAQSVFGIIISHKAAHSHKGKWLGLTGLITAAGCIVYILPHLVTPSYSTLDSYQLYDNQSDFCLEHNRSIPNVCQQQNISKGVYLFIFCIGQFVLGAGTSILATVGWSYLDESVSPDISPVFTGINVSIIGLSTAFGFAFGGTALDLYVYWPFRKPGPGLTPNNPNWIGAWWLGYVLTGICVAIGSIPMFAFPRHLPNYELYKKQRKEQAIGKSSVDKQYGTNLKEIIPACKELLCNLPYVCTTLSLVGHLIVLAGMGTFLPKYLEAQYGISAADASMYSGLIIVIGMLLGVILVGILLKKKKLGVLMLAKYNWMACCLSILTAFAFIITRCPSTAIAGVNVSYFNDTSAKGTNHLAYNLSIECNLGCHCSTDNFKPVCDQRTGITYFSPCYAGCLSGNDSIAKEEIFYNCSCLSGWNLMNNSDAISQHVIMNYCPKPCNALIPFLILGTLFAFLVFCTLIPSFQIIFRCVPESQRSLALAIEKAIILVLATTPGPIIMGAFIDSACNLWKEDCGERKFCWIYDSHSLALAITGVLAIMKVFSTIFSFLTYYFMKRDIERYEVGDEQTIINENLSSASKDDQSFHEHPLLQPEDISNDLEKSVVF